MGNQHREGGSCGPEAHDSGPQAGATIVLDGRTRLRALREAGITLIPVCNAELRGDKPEVYMLRAALRHRHMTRSQLAAVGVELKKQYEGPAAEKQQEGRSEGGKKSSAVRRGEECLPANLRASTRDRSGEAAEQAAREVGASARNIQTAEMVSEKAPDLFEQVKQGQVTVHQAAVEVKRREKRAELVANAAGVQSSTRSWQLEPCCSRSRLVPRGSCVDDRHDWNREPEVQGWCGKGVVNQKFMTGTVAEKATVGAETGIPVSGAGEPPTSRWQLRPKREFAFRSRCNCRND